MIQLASIVPFPKDVPHGSFNVIVQLDVNGIISAFPDIQIIILFSNNLLSSNCLFPYSETITFVLTVKLLPLLLQ